MAGDELPVDVLTELGRVTWAAIKLEDYAESVCAFIDPVNPRTDRRQVSTKIKDARKVMATWPDTSPRDEATAWLERTRLALERRNAVLHATPMVWIDQGGNEQLFLGEMPRKDSLYTERPLTVESLAELRSQLDAAADGWRDVVMAVGQYQRASRGPTDATP